MVQKLTSVHLIFDSKEIKPVLKEISPEYSLKGLMLKLQYLSHLM